MIQCDPNLLLRAETVRLDRGYGLDWEGGKDKANKRTRFGKVDGFFPVWVWTVLFFEQGSCKPSL